MIRKARKKDLKRITEIFRKEYRKAPYNEKWPKKISLAKIRRYFKNNFMFVFEEKKEIVGFIIGYIELWDRGKVGYIDEVVISKKYQGKGYGKALMERLIKQFKKQKIKHIDLMSNSKSNAFKIYKKMGFNVMKDFLYMTKKLK
jgi:ribosomal protein S18 acetylase RimI-like enzyme